MATNIHLLKPAPMRGFLIYGWKFLSKAKNKKFLGVAWKILLTIEGHRL
ncbi:hypothetical protein [Paenibacillus sp. GP183]|jgi:hypothetical protein|nr:hypothetical protein [Paenibacillus sp. GP183]SEB50412.1 hypothetical protein SAMN05443246_0751 [Paenibacillus sp. GP183]